MLSTGGGLRAQFEGASDENMIDALESAAANSGQPDNLYVGPGGPDETTTPGARNLWEEITANFIYFQRLHALVGSRPNLNPIVIRNGSGETHYPQPRSPDAPPSNMLPPALQWDPSMFTQEDATQAGGFLEMLHATLPAMPGQSPAYSFGSSGASDYSSAVGTPMGTPMLVPISIQAQEGMHAASTQAPSTGRLVPPHVVGTPQQAAPAGPTSTPQETGKKGKKKPAPKAPKPSTMSEEALKQAAAKAAGSAKPKKGMEDTLTSLLKYVLSCSYCHTCTETPSRRNAVLQQAKQKSDEEHRNKQLALDLFNAKAISKQQLHDMLGLRKKKRSDSDGDASASFSKRRRVSDVELPSSDNNDSEDETDESLDDDEGESRGSDDDGEDDDVEFEFAVRAS